MRVSILTKMYVTHLINLEGGGGGGLQFYTRLLTVGCPSNNPCQQYFW